MAAGPRLAAAFRVEIDGREIGIARVSGLALAEEAGGPGDGKRAGPAPLRVTLTRALDGDRRLYDWRREAAEKGEAAARRVAVRQLDPATGAPLAAFVLEGWPVAWTGPEFDANAGGLAWESLEILAHDLIWLEEESR
jgi:phage tail-like protein